MRVQRHTIGDPQSPIAERSALAGGGGTRRAPQSIRMPSRPRSGELEFAAIQKQPHPAQSRQTVVNHANSSLIKVNQGESSPIKVEKNPGNPNATTAKAAQSRSGVEFAAIQKQPNPAQSRQIVVNRAKSSLIAFGVRPSRTSTLWNPAEDGLQRDVASFRRSPGGSTTNRRHLRLRRASYSSPILPNRTKSRLIQVGQALRLVPPEQRKGGCGPPACQPLHPSRRLPLSHPPRVSHQSRSR